MVVASTEGDRAKRNSDFDEIDEFSNEQTKKAFHESLSEMGPTFCVFFVSFSFSFFILLCLL